MMLKFFTKEGVFCMHKRMISIMCFMLTIILAVEPVMAFPGSEGYAGHFLYSAAYDPYRADTEAVSVSDDSLSDNTVSGDSVSDNAVSDNTVSGDSISENTVSDNAVSNNTISRNTADAGDDLVAEQAAVFPLQTATTVMKDIGQTVAAVFTKSVKKPAQVKKLTLTNPAKGKLRIRYQKVTGAKGYEIVYATNRSFTASKIVLDVKKTKTDITELPQGKTYYVKVRAYKTDEDGKKIYGKYSSKKKLTIKKGLAEIEAKKGAAKLGSVKLADASTVKATAKVKKRVKSSDEFYYLFALDSYQSKVSGLKPVAKAAKKKSVTFTLPLQKETKNSVLQKKFVVAVKKGRKYIMLSDAMYITNPEKTAYFSYPFPTAPSKKGLQINADMMPDVEELGVKNTAYNIILSDIIATAGQHNAQEGISYEYNGKTYWFSRSAVQGYDSLFLKTRAENMVVTGILLLGYRSDLTYLIAPKGRSQGHQYYMFNTKSKKARLQLEAACSFLAERYSGNAYVTNWVVGNEVNAYQDWNYAGLKNIQEYAAAYAEEYRLVATCMKSMYQNARVYISLDNNWTRTTTGVYAGKKFLDQFAQELEKEGKIGFHIAYHPYSYPLTTADFWNDTSGLAGKGSKAKVITMANLSVMTNYVKKTYGKNTRILLSETGFSSGQSEQIQAAAIAYAYYIAESNDMVDALIISRHVDNEVEIRQNIRTGLWTTYGDSLHPNEWADRKKYAWYVFKYMDTTKSSEWTDFALNYIRAASWESLIPGFSQSRFLAMRNMDSAEVLQQEKIAAKYVQPISLQGSESQTLSYRGSGLNKNVSWGFSKKYDVLVSFTMQPYFVTRLQVSGSTNRQVTVKLRFCSGENVLEAEKVIPTEEYVNLAVKVSDWQYAGLIDKIEIYFQPAGGAFVSGAKAKLDGKRTGIYTGNIE